MGVIGSDIYGNKIRADLEERGVDIKYVEINYENPTAMNYILLNTETGSSTQIIKDNPEVNLVKYKYEFVPDFIIMDGTDMSGSLAAVNNFPKAKSILLANKISQDIHSLSKKVTYVVANVGFAQALAKMELQIGKPKLLVAFLQKIRDLNKSEYIVMMREHGVLYSSDREVKMIPAIDIEKKMDDTNGGNVFFAAFCYGIVNGYGVDASVKMANISAGLSLTKMGTIDCLPTLEEVLQIGHIQKPEVVTQTTDVSSIDVVSGEVAEELNVIPTEPLNQELNPQTEMSASAVEEPSTASPEEVMNTSASEIELPTPIESSTPTEEQSPAELPLMPASSEHKPEATDVPPTGTGNIFD